MEPVTELSPHLCRSTRAVSPATLDAPLLTRIDQWGYVAVPFPLQRLTPHSLSRRVRDLLAGDVGAHRHLPTDSDEDAETVTPLPAAVAKHAAYSKEDSQRAWSKRRADLDDLADVAELLDVVDARAEELAQRIAAILVEETDHNEVPSPSPVDPLQRLKGGGGARNAGQATLAGSHVLSNLVLKAENDLVELGPLSLRDDGNIPPE